MDDYFELLGEQIGHFNPITVTVTTGDKFSGEIEWIKDGVVALRPKHGRGDYHRVLIENIIVLTRSVY